MWGTDLRAEILELFEEGQAMVREHQIRGQARLYAIYIEGRREISRLNKWNDKWRRKQNRWRFERLPRLFLCECGEAFAGERGLRGHRTKVHHERVSNSA